MQGRDIMARHSGIWSRALLSIPHRCEAKAAIRGSGVRRGCQWLIPRHSRPARERKRRTNVRAPHQNVEISPPPTFFTAAMTHDRRRRRSLAPPPPLCHAAKPSRPEYARVCAELVRSAAHSGKARRWRRDQSPTLRYPPGIEKEKAKEKTQARGAGHTRTSESNAPVCDSARASTENRRVSRRSGSKRASAVPYLVRVDVSSALRLAGRSRYGRPKIWRSRAAHQPTSSTPRRGIQSHASSHTLPAGTVAKSRRVWKFARSSVHPPEFHVDVHVGLRLREPDKTTEAT
jgi:hypothetical protein